MTFLPQVLQNICYNLVKQRLKEPNIDKTAAFCGPSKSPVKASPVITMQNILRLHNMVNLCAKCCARFKIPDCIDFIITNDSVLL